MAVSIEPRRRGGRFRAVRLSVTHVAIGLVGLAAGIVAAVFSYSRFPDWWLALFVFAMVTYILGWGLAEVLTRSRRVQRALYFVLGPAVSVAALYGVYLLWNRMWLAVILGSVVGGIAQAGIGLWLFPGIAAEETRANMWDRGAQERGAPVPGDVARRWARGLVSHPLRSAALGMVTDQYYTAIRQRDYARAYGYLAPDARAAVSQEAFAQQALAQDAAHGPVEEFSNPPVSVDDPATVAVFVTRSGTTYTVHLQLRHDGGGWRITAFDGI